MGNLHVNFGLSSDFHSPVKRRNGKNGRTERTDELSDGVQCITWPLKGEGWITSCRTGKQFDEVCVVGKAEIAVPGVHASHIGSPLRLIRRGK